MDGAVELVGALEAPERHPARERGDEAVGAGDLGQPVDRQYGRDREPAVEGRRQQPPLAQPYGEGGNAVADQAADQ